MELNKGSAVKFLENPTALRALQRTALLVGRRVGRGLASRLKCHKKSLPVITNYLLFIFGQPWSYACCKTINNTYVLRVLKHFCHGLCNRLNKLYPTDKICYLATPVICVTVLEPPFRRQTVKTTI